MKLPFKIVLINVAIVFLIGLLTFDKNAILTIFGMAGLSIGAIDIIAGILLLFMKDKRYAQGFLLSGGLLLLIGFICCSNSQLHL